MIKKAICLMFAALLLCGLCACANNNKTIQPTEAPKPTDTPAATQQAATAVPATQAPANYDPYEGLSEDTVLVAFDGIVSAGLTVAQAKQQQLVELDRGTEEDVPAMSGMLLKDVLALVGAENAKSVTVNFDEASFARTFELAKLDMDSAMVYFLRNGKAMGEGKCCLVITDADGFEYTLDVEKPLTLG